MRTWFQKVMVLFLCFIVMLSTIGSKVMADVIATPNDDFYEEHYEECEHSVRTYIANSKKGYVDIYRNPESKKTITYLLNDTKVQTTFTYVNPNGITWGVVEDQSILGAFSEDAGWIRLDEFVVVYDHEEFLKEHQEEIVAQPVDWDLSTYQNDIYLWTYPNSGIQSGVIDPTTDYAANYSKTYDQYYEDEEDNRWVYIGYYMTMKGWICIDDPENDAISEVDTSWEEGVTLYPAAVPDPMNPYYREVAIVAVMVLAVVLLTVVMIRVLYRKGRNK